MNKTKAYLQTITAHVPDLAVQTARLHNADGQYNDILIVNEAIIFRFPRYADGVRAMQNEVRVLPQIQGRTPIPNPIYTNLDSATPASTP